MVRSRPSPWVLPRPMGACPAAQPAGALYGASHRPSSSSCRSRAWYSAMGSRNTDTVPFAFAAATQVRSIAAASSGLDGEAMTSPGTSRSTPTALSLWKCPPNPFW